MERSDVMDAMGKLRLYGMRAAYDVRLDFGHKATVIVVKDGARHRAEEGKGIHMPIKPSLGVGRRICPYITGIAVRQIKGKEVGLLLNPPITTSASPKSACPCPGGRSHMAIALYWAVSTGMWDAARRTAKKNSERSVAGHWYHYSNAA